MVSNFLLFVLQSAYRAWFTGTWLHAWDLPCTPSPAEKDVCALFSPFDFHKGLSVRFPRTLGNVAGVSKISSGNKWSQIWLLRRNGFVFYDIKWLVFFFQGMLGNKSCPVAQDVLFIIFIYWAISALQSPFKISVTNVPELPFVF